jgi:hypothetical protein
MSFLDADHRSATILGLGANLRGKKWFGWRFPGEPHWRASVVSASNMLNFGKHLGDFSLPSS